MVSSPPVPHGFWASLPNGELPYNPVYYICTCNAQPAQIFKSIGQNKRWTPVSVVVTQGAASMQLQILQAGSGYSGPLFVDPINPNRLLVLTTQGVALSSDGGGTWILDTALTALVTKSGLYAKTKDFPSANANGVVIATRGRASGGRGSTGQSRLGGWLT